MSERLRRETLCCMYPSGTRRSPKPFFVPQPLVFFKARTVHEASLEDVRRLEERRDAEATVLHQVERTETALRYIYTITGVSYCGERGVKAPLLPWCSAVPA